MKRKDLGVAVIGAGRIGSLRARLAARHPAVHFLAVSDLNAGNARALAERTEASRRQVTHELQRLDGENADGLDHPRQLIVEHVHIDVPWI